MSIQRVAVLGAGTMGAGIAQACAQAGLDVVLRDLTDEHTQKGLDRIRQPLEKRVAQGKTTRDEVDAIFGRIRTTTDLKEAVGDADLVIEAVFEDLKVKQEVFAEADASAPPGCVFATNTSSLKVAEIAAATSRPDRFGGLHYFYPAQANRLVEVVATSQTSPETVRALDDFADATGKIPIRTADSEGFCVNRFFVPWVNEAVRLRDEDVADIPSIDAAAKDAFGIGMGPFELMNVTGVAISLHAQRTLYKAFGDFYAPAAGLVRQVEETRKDWTLDGTPDPTKAHAVRERLLGVVFGIAAQLVDEGVCSTSDTDKGAVVGLRWQKGPFALMNELGIGDARDLAKQVNKRWGDHFPLAKNLAKHARARRSWTVPGARLDVDGPVATLTLGRPGSLNALDPGLLRELESALLKIGRDDKVRVVVLTGEGPAFIAGADIKAMARMAAHAAKAYARQGHRVARMLSHMPKVSIAAVNGYAFGGGLELALACDLVVVAEEAELGLPEVTLGIAPGFGGSVRLPRIVGPQRAKEIVLTGRRLRGPEAVALGIAVAAYPRARLRGAVRGLAGTIAANAPLAVASAKRVIDGGLDERLEQALAFELQQTSRLFKTRDRQEGLTAFVEKRQPDFRGR